MAETLLKLLDNPPKPSVNCLTSTKQRNNTLKTVQIYFNNQLIEAVEQDDHYLAGALKISKDDAIIIDPTNPWKNFTASVSLKDILSEAKYVVQDEDGEIKFFDELPVTLSHVWYSDIGSFGNSDYGNENKNWRKAFTTVEAIRQFVEASKAPEVRHDPNAFKVGDVVRVVRMAEDGEVGWDNSWAENMDRMVGKECTIAKNFDSKGFNMYEGFSFPSFVLELVEEKSYKVSELRKMTLQQIADLLAKG